MSSVTPSDSSIRTEFAHVQVQADNQGVNLPTRIQRELRDFFATSEASADSIQKLLAMTAEYVNSDYVGFFQATGEKIAAVAVHGNGPRSGKFTLPEFTQLCQEAILGKDLVTKPINEAERLFGIAVPSIGSEPVPTVLAAVVTPDAPGMVFHTAVLERMSAAIMQWRMNEAMAALDWQAATSAAIAELVSGIQQTETIRESSYSLVNSIQDFLNCEQVAISFAKTVGVGCELKAISGMAEFDKKSETAEHLTSAMEECLIREETTVWPPIESDARHATICHRQLAERSNHGAAASIPLVADDETIGVLTVVGDENNIRSPRVQSVLDAAGPHLATALSLKKQAEPGRLTQVKRWVLGDASQPRKKWFVAAGLIATLLVPCIPWRHKVKSDCVVEPVVRRFMVAPFDGKLKDSSVRPGDIVKEGQALAQMDDRELQLELSDTLAERARESTKRDQAMDLHNTSEAKLAELEMERLTSRFKLLTKRERELAITSPISGVVLKGDLDDAVGAPVKVGQTLFEIAPLDPIKLEIAIPEMDLPSVEDGMTVEANIDGFRDEKIIGTISKIHPRAEIRDSKNVFIAEVEFENPGNALRPGMSGVARVKSQIRPLGWIWFHKAWHRTRTFFGV